MNLYTRTCRHLPSYQRRHHRARVVARGLVGLAREVDVPHGAEAGAREGAVA